MGWKDWPSWVKGGIIGAIVGLIIRLIVFLFFGFWSVLLEGFLFKPLIIGRNLGFLIIPLVWIGFAFIIGAIIAKLYNKSKQENISFLVIILSLFFGVIAINFILRVILSIINLRLVKNTPMILTLTISGLIGIFIGLKMGKIKSKKK